MRGEVPTREFGKSLFAQQPFCPRHPFVEQHESLLFAFAGPKAQKTLVREAPEDVDAPLSSNGDLCALKRVVGGPRE